MILGGFLMKSIYKKIIVVVGLLLTAGVFMFLNGWLSSTKYTHPPCDQLPNVKKVEKALESHQDFVEAIIALGDNIEVTVGKLCSDDKNRALIKVNFHSTSERDAISDFLGSSEGFGVPVHMVKR